jgi:hypothetical protein
MLDEFIPDLVFVTFRTEAKQLHDSNELKIDRVPFAVGISVLAHPSLPF